MQEPGDQLAAGAVRHPVSQLSLAALAGAGLALAAAITLACLSANALRQDLVFTAAATELGFWGRGDYQPAEVTRNRVGDRVHLLLANSPTHPDYLNLAASYYAWKAYWGESLDLAERYNHRALSAQYTAQQNRPAYRQGWATMLGYAAGADGAAQQYALAQRRLSALSDRAGAGEVSQPGS